MLLLLIFLLLFLLVFFFFFQFRTTSEVNRFYVIPLLLGVFVFVVIVLVHFSLKLNVEVSGSTSLPGKGPKLGLLFCFKMVQIFSFDKSSMLVYDSLPWFYPLSPKNLPQT